MSRVDERQSYRRLQDELLKKDALLLENAATIERLEDACERCEREQMKRREISDLFLIICGAAGMAGLFLASVADFIPAFSAMIASVIAFRASRTARSFEDEDFLFADYISMSK